MILIIEFFYVILIANKHCTVIKQVNRIELSFLQTIFTIKFIQLKKYMGYIFCDPLSDSMWIIFLFSSPYQHFMISHLRNGITLKIW